MDYSKSWDELLKIFNESSRYKIIEKNGDKSHFCWSIAIYTIVSVSSFVFSLMSYKLFVLGCLAIVTSAFLIHLYLTRKVISYSLEQYPYTSFFMKEEIIRYREFKKEFENNEILKFDQASKLLEWEEARCKKKQSYNILTHPLCLVFYSVIFTVFLNIYEAPEVKAQVTFISLSLLLVVALVIQAGRELFENTSRKRFEIVKYLKLISIEK